MLQDYIIYYIDKHYTYRGGLFCIRFIPIPKKEGDEISDYIGDMDLITHELLPVFYT